MVKTLGHYSTHQKYVGEAMSKPVIYTRPSKSFKQEAAIERNTKWNELTHKQQLESLAKRRGESKKQIKKILERIDKDETKA